MNASFYILWSDLACKFYIGHTTEPIAERIRKHNANHKGFTGKFQDWKLVHQEAFPSKQSAYGREREVKAWKNKTKVLKLIAGSGHPA